VAKQSRSVSPAFYSLPWGEPPRFLPPRDVQAAGCRTAATRWRCRSARASARRSPTKVRNGRRGHVERPQAAGSRPRGAEPPRTKAATKDGHPEAVCARWNQAGG